MRNEKLCGCWRSVSLFGGSLCGVFLGTVAGWSLSLAAGEEGGELKSWPVSRLEVVRALYRDPAGHPSREVFERVHGLLPADESREVIPCFAASFATEDLVESDGAWRPLPDAKPLHLDFFVEHRRTFRSARRALPLWDGRVYEEAGRLLVGGYSSKNCERPVGEIDAGGRFVAQSQALRPEEFPLLGLPAEELVFDPFAFALLRVQPAGEEEVEEHSRSFLPIPVAGRGGGLIEDVLFALETVDGGAELLLSAVYGDQKAVLAQCRMADAPFLERREGYRPSLGTGCIQPGDGPVATLVWKAAFAGDVKWDSGTVRLVSPAAGKDSPADDGIRDGAATRIDGDFSDWRSVAGVGDTVGDHVSYLYPNPDTDLLEFKVSNDAEHLYLYARVTGAFGRTGPRGRYYWYAYIDADSDPATGYVPTRDDNCYFGVALGDDCEAQFEFVGGKFIKTFFGFTGVGTETEVLDGRVTLGPSHYAPTDSEGRKRDRYKVEYVHRRGSRFITHDNIEGTSEDIVMALSPDASEMEMRVALSGFLETEPGQPVLAAGRRIDLAVGAEAASDHYGASEWGADSTPVMYQYEIQIPRGKRR